MFFVTEWLTTHSTALCALFHPLLINQKSIKRLDCRAPSQTCGMRGMLDRAATTKMKWKEHPGTLKKQSAEIWFHHCTRSLEANDILLSLTPSRAGKHGMLGFVFFSSIWKHAYESHCHKCPVQGKGRRLYLQRRGQIRPEEKFDFPLLSSWEYGWRLGESDSLLPGRLSRVTSLDFLLF